MSKYSKSPDDPKPSADLKGDEKVHAEALEIFELCVENEAENRIEFLDDLRFARLGEQWPESVRKQRERDGRPCLTVNKMPAFIRQVVNDARQNKPSISVHPADDDADPDTAQVIEGLIRNIEVTSNADVAYDTGLDFAVSAGWGYLRVNTEYASDDTFEQDLVIDAVSDPLTVYGDPYERGADSQDWNHAFVVSTMPKDEFEATYKGEDPVDWDNGPYANIPTSWSDGELVVIAEYWRREPSQRQIVALSDGMVCDLAEYNANKAEAVAAGLVIVGKPRTVASHKVVQYTMSGCEVLKTTPWAGRYIPIIPVYGEDIIVEGKRHLRSMIRDAKDAQRRVNFHTSAVTELVALAPRAPFIGKVGTFETDALKWETANSESHAYIEFDGEMPQRQQFAGVPAGEMQQVLLASDDMKAIMGLHDASLGARSNETSGVAIKARQHEGDVSTFNFNDNLTRAIRHLGRVLLDMIPEVYSVARIIRTMGQDGTPKKVSINQQPGMGHNGGPGMGDGDDESAADLKVYDLTMGKYDLVVKAGPAFSTRREEAAAQMMELMQAFPAAAPVIGDLFAKNLDWPGADEISKRLHALLPPQLQAQFADHDGAPTGGAPVQPGQPPQPGAPGAPLSPEALQAHTMLAQATQAAQALSQQVAETKAALAQTQAELTQVKGDRDLENRKLDIAEFEAVTKRQAADNGHRVAMIGATASEPASATTL